MAKFSIGQRVKIARVFDPIDRAYIGSEGVIESNAFERFGQLAYLTTICTRLIFESSLEPLTDGETDAWAADAVRKLVKPEPVAPPLPVKERA